MEIMQALHGRELLLVEHDSLLGQNYFIPFIYASLKTGTVQ